LTADRFGNPNSAYYFDGKDDYINIENHPLSYHYVTVSLWIKTNKNQVNWGAFSWNTLGNPGGIDIAASKNVSSCAFRDEAWTKGSYPVITGIPLTGNKWQMVTFVYNNKGAYFYVDAVLKNSKSRESTLSNQNQRIHIGHLANHEIGYYHFDGSVDDVRIYNRALTELEIQALYKQAQVVLNKEE